MDCEDDGGEVRVSDATPVTTGNAEAAANDDDDDDEALAPPV
jgi:hypothetical protein